MSVHPFSCGSQHGDWRASNCDRCTKYAHNPNESKCEIDKAILQAQFGNGTITDEIAQRMGYFDNNGKDGFAYVWMCNEVEWAEEHKKAFKANHPTPQTLNGKEAI